MHTSIDHITKGAVIIIVMPSTPTTPIVDAEICETSPHSPRPDPDPILQQHVIVLPRVASLIDNTLAMACSLKRARGTPSPLRFKKSVSYNSGLKLNCRSTKFTYAGVHSKLRPVKITSASTESTPAPTLVQSESAPCLLNIDPYSFIETMIDDEHDCGEDGPTSPSRLRRRRSSVQPLHENEFNPPTPEQIAAYTNVVIQAVRSSDIEALRSIHLSGQSLRCCNRFGESLLHVACRRSTADVVAFLLNEAKVSPRIKDDYGRTPLHDAVWRASPEVGIVELILNVEPRLAFVEDVRGHKPFQYARKEHWGCWRQFLVQKKDLILT